MNTAAWCQAPASTVANHPDASFNLGITFGQQGQFDEAVTCLRRAIALRPDYPDAYNNLGIALQKQGRLDEAVSCYRRLIALHPDHADAHNNLGFVLGQQKRPEEAEACHRKAIALRPNHPEAYNNLGIVLRQRGQLDEAAACYRKTIEIKPNYPDAHSNLGNVLRQQGRLDESIACHQAALALRPDYPEAFSNLGGAFWEQGQLDEAVACYRRAVALKPGFSSAHSNLGVALWQQGRQQEAMARYRRAIELEPDFADAHHHLAMALLAQGDLTAGWQEYEWRWQTPQMIGHRRNFTQPQWRGEAAAGRTLLIHAEQGFGDSLQFCRYAALAAARGLRVIIEAQAPLVRLLRRLSGVDQVVARGDRLPPFDLHCPMLSLPLAFGTTLATIPNKAAYLRADVTQAEAWRLRLDAMTGQGPRIGLVWAGGLTLRTDCRRSMSLDRLAPLLDLPGFHFFSLQKNRSPALQPPQLTDCMSEMADFADTAALIANLDLVISVDTAVAHLAAALGKPVWLLDRFDPDWRWLRGRRDSPWYPTLRLYRQTHAGDWDPVVAEVVRDLCRLFPTDHAASRRQGAQPDDAAARHREESSADPTPPEAYSNQGIVLQRQGQLDEAVAHYRKAIELRPNYPEAHNNLGVAFRQLRRLDEAVACYRTVVELRPDFPNAYSNLGQLLWQQGRRADAVACYRRATEVAPDCPTAFHQLGVALGEQRQLEEAGACFRKVIELKPELPNAHTNLGITLGDQGRLSEAASCCRRAIEIRPDYPEGHNNLGFILGEQGALEDAVACFRKAIDLKPHYPDALRNLGVTLRKQGRADEAIACYRQAIELSPDYPEAHGNLAMALLEQGDMAAGWAEYEWRWQMPQMIRQRRPFTQPQWRGEAGEGRTLLIHAEQGFGDSLQFCRYAPMAAALGLRVVIEVPKPLVRLLCGLPGIDRVMARGDELPAFDFHCPMLSLPMALGIVDASLLSSAPYLHANTNQAAAWRGRLAAIGDPGPRIGVAWAGNPQNHSCVTAAVNHRRSIAADRLAPLFGQPGLRFFSLQKDGPAAPDGFPLVDFMGEMDDFADTAALVANLDLVISVDTAVAHLAAALGKPVWLLNRFDSCWRWFLGRRDSPWYPTLRLYRQPRPNDWDSVVAEVARDLRCLYPASPVPPGVESS